MFDFIFGFCFGFGFLACMIYITIMSQIRKGEKTEEILYNYLTEREGENGKGN